MSNLKKKLERQQANFNRKLRRLLIVIGGAALLIVGFLAYLHFAPPKEEQAGSGPKFGEKELRDPTVVPSSDPDDPSQLVIPGLIMGERPANPVAITSTGKKTKLDANLFSIALEAVKRVPQKELEARVDHNIQWVDFTEPDEREPLRGRVCEFRGTLRRLEKTENIQFPELGIDELYEGQLETGDGRWFSFYCLEKPEQEIGRSDIAILTGVFYKLIRYTTRGGEELITPLMVARTITSTGGYKGSKTVGDKITGYVPTWIMYLAFAVLAIGLCALLHWRMKRPLKRYRPPDRD